MDRVHSANSIYLQPDVFAHWLHQLGLGYSIENPTNSLLWWIPAYRELLPCVHGPERLKHTSVLINVPELNTLAVQCDGQHSHKPWGLADGQFTTAQEAAYPEQFVRICLRLHAVASLTIGNVTLPKTRSAAQIHP